jgi:hypothetical protein
MEKQRIKEFSQLIRKEYYEQDFTVSSDNVLSSDRNIIKSFLVAQRSPLELLQSLWVLSSSHPLRTVQEARSSFLFLSYQSLKRFDVFATIS